MLNEVNFPLTNSQITEFLVKYQYATYFETQQTVSELTAANLITKETVHHSTKYAITETGEQTLTYYRHQIPDSFLADIQEYLQENKIELRIKASVIAGYTAADNGEYAVQMKLLEKGKSIFDMTLLTPSTDLAEQMCFNWEKKQAAIYSYIMAELVDGE